jgi:hypothetical protein
MLQKYTFLRVFQVGRCHHCGFAALREIIFFSPRRQAQNAISFSFKASRLCGFA